MNIPPHLDAKNVYFILDQNARDGEEFIAKTGILEQGKFVHVMADKPLEPRGELTLQHLLVLPKKSNTEGISLNGKGMSTSLESYKKGLDLADALDNFDPAILVTKTAEARRLLQERKVDRIQHPEKYPDLDTMTPGAYWCTDGSINIEEHDYLKSSSLILYMASSIEEVERISRGLKTFSNYAFFVNPSATDAGVYNPNPLSLRRGFKLSSTGNLLVSGEYYLPDENFELESNENMWSLGQTVRVGGGIHIYSYRNLTFSSLSPGFTRPADMPIAIWKNFKQFALRRYDMRLGD